MNDIRVTVKVVPHPDPQRLVNVWANIVLEELKKQEMEKRAGTEDKNTKWR